MLNFSHLPCPIKKLFLLCAGLLLSLSLTGCTISNKSSSNYITDTRICLDTYITITLYDCKNREILDECFDMVSRYQDIYSRTLNYSELYKINQSHELKIPISNEMADLLKICIKYGEDTNGAFDVSIGAVSSLWDFTSDSPAVPSESAIKSGLSHVNYKNISISLENGQHFLVKEEPETTLELGGIAKGYIADRLKSYLVSEGVDSAIIDLGGNILCVGEHLNGRPFQIGIQKPFSEGSYIAVAEVSDYSVVTSGSYQRYFETGGRIYHHILDPATGFPVENNLVSVTIFSKSSVDADALSTSCFILGTEKGMELIDSISDTYAIFIDQELNIIYSNGLKEAFNIKEQ